MEIKQTSEDLAINQATQRAGELLKEGHLIKSIFINRHFNRVELRWYDGHESFINLYEFGEVK